MPRRNIEIAEGVYGDAPITDAPELAPDAEFDFTALYPDQPVLRGVHEMRRFRDSGPWGTSLSFVPERFVDIDAERVLVLLRTRSRGRASGVELATELAHELTLRDGLVVRVKTYRTHAGALAALGLDPPGR
jgi:ketosteroid isomerase-like protein